MRTFPSLLSRFLYASGAVTECRRMCAVNWVRPQRTVLSLYRALQEQDVHPSAREEGSSLDRPSSPNPLIRADYGLCPVAFRRAARADRRQQEQLPRSARAKTACSQHGMDVLPTRDTSSYGTDASVASLALGLVLLREPGHRIARTERSTLLRRLFGNSP